MIKLNRQHMGYETRYFSIYYCFDIQEALVFKRRTSFTHPVLIYSSTGSTSCILMISLDFSPTTPCNITLRLFHSILSLSFFLVLHNVACITIERFCAITQSKYKITKENVWKWVTCTTTYVFSTWLIIEIAYYNNGCWTYNSIICSKFGIQTTTKIVKESHSVAIAVLATWLSGCNITIIICTCLTLISIGKTKKLLQQKLQGQMDKVNTRRIKATFALSVFFVALWIPYGVIIGQRNNIDHMVYAHLSLYFPLLSYASFTVVPATYFFLDRRFERYVKGSLKKRVGAQANAAHNENQRARPIHAEKAC